MSDEKIPQENELILYSTPNGSVKVEMFYESESFWLTQKQIAQLFGADIRTVNEHLMNIFDSGELQQISVIRNFRITAADGKNYPTNFYNLDAIIAVGYRVSSRQATQFRIWATNTLKEFIVKGFVLDDERLKLNKRFGKDYFDELLDKIREIRASERRFYLKITDIYEQCNIDYNPNSEITENFFKTVQNKLHWAITGETAAELISNRAQADKLNMGLQTWKNAPRGKILIADVKIAKNYLSEKEIKELDRFISMYLDYADLQASRQKPMKMADWAKKLDAFLQFNEYQILNNSGAVSHEVAIALASQEYEKYRVIQDKEYISDFERETKKITDSHKRGKGKA